MAGAREALPKFIIIPPTITFFTNDRASHRQDIKLYNLHDYPISFEVQATAPRKFFISEDEGTVKPNCTVTITIQHTDIRVDNEGRVEKFRLRLYRMMQGRKHLLGCKYINAQLLPRRPDGPAEGEENFHSMQAGRSRSSASSIQSAVGRVGDGPPPNRQSLDTFILLVIGAILSCAMLLPEPGTEDTYIPTTLHFTVKTRYGITFALGVILVLLVQSFNR